MTEIYCRSTRLNQILEIMGQALAKRTMMMRKPDGSYDSEIDPFLSTEQKLVTYQLAAFAKAIVDLGMSLSVADGDNLAGAVAPLLTRISHVEFGVLGNADKIAELEQLSHRIEDQFAHVGLKLPDKYWRVLRGE